MLVLSSVRIPLKGLKVTARQKIAGKDMSGNSAATDQAETGNKAKTLAITGSIPYTTPDVLNMLYTMSGAKEKGARVVYRIDNRTASALKISQCKFQGTVSAQEDAQLRQWLVSFELVEHMSVAERTENRQPPKKAAQQKAQGVETPVEQPDESAETPPDTEVELTGTMKYLKHVDNWLAP